MTNKKGNKGKGSGKKSNKKTSQRNPQPPTSSQEEPVKVEEIIEVVDELAVADDTSDFTTGDAIVNVIHDYFPPELRTIVRNKEKVSNDDELRGDEYLTDGGMGVIRRFMDKYPGNFKMYGSPEDVYQQLREYQKFPANHRYFRMKMDHPYSNTASISVLVRLSAEVPRLELTVKQDFYVIVYNQIVQKWPDMPEYCRRFLAIYMKTLETRVQHVHEFGGLDFFQPERLDMKIAHCEHMAMNEREELEKFQLKPANASLEEICEQWKSRFYRFFDLRRVTENDVNEKKKLFGNVWIEWNDVQLQPIRCLIEKYIKEFPPDGNQEKYAEFFFICQTLADILYDLCAVDDFNPFETTETGNGFPFVRKFHVYDKTMLMLKSELYHHHPDSMSNIEYETEENSRFLQAISYTGARLQCGIREKHFIDYHIGWETFSMRPIPILTPFGGFCLYGGAGFKMALRRVTSSFRLFQRLYKGDHANRFMKRLVDIFNKYFEFDRTSPYFIKMEQMRELDVSLNHLFDQISSNPMQNTRIPIEPKEVPANGMYTIKELRKQMDNMMLGMAFPEIKQKAEKAMKQVGRGDWTTRELIDILDRCQASCFIDKFPVIHEYLHRQFIPHEPCSLCRDTVYDFLFDW